MSKKPKTAFSDDLWAVEYVDHISPDDGHVSASMTRSEAEARYAELTNNGEKKTEHDKGNLGFYRLIRVKK